MLQSERGFVGAHVKTETRAQATSSKLRTSRFGTQAKAREIEKPQLHFQHVPTNRESGPFVPLLINKPHAATPLVTEATISDGDSQARYSLTASAIYIHTALFLICWQLPASLPIRDRELQIPCISLHESRADCISSL
jgi:hypothetical protein